MSRTELTAQTTDSPAVASRLPRHVARLVSVTSAGYRWIAKSRLRTLIAGVAVALLGWFVTAELAPGGLPPGIVVLGLVTGSLSALTAIGLVLIYRSTRIINFAQAEIGAVAGAATYLLNTRTHWPYLLAVIAGLLLGLVSGALMQVLVVRPFFRAPRLILSVATIGAAQLFGALGVLLPFLIASSDPRQLTVAFHAPITFNWDLHAVLVTADWLIAMITVPAVVFGLWYLLTRTDTGIAIRASADSQERAVLLGIPTQLLSLATWMLAGLLSATGAVLAVGVQGGVRVGNIGGPSLLLAPLTAAVIAGFDSVPITLISSLLIGVASAAIFHSTSKSALVDVALFGVIIAVLMLRRFPRARGAGDPADHIALREVRRLPAAVRALPEYRWTRLVGWGLLAFLFIVAPLKMANSQLIFVTFALIFSVIAASLVVLTGLAGQMSLGQFAFVGLGAATTGSLLVSAHADLIFALLASAAVGSIVALIIGVPALRMPGLYLAAATLALSVPVSSYVLNRVEFPKFAVYRVPVPLLFERYDLTSPLSFYYFIATCCAIAIGLALNYRRSHLARMTLTVRDNEPLAAALAISPTKVKLRAFAVSGGLAGFAGGLYVLATQGIPFNGFTPVLSLQVLAMSVVGGLGSIFGGVIGAAYVFGAEFYLRGAGQLVATGAGMVVVLWFVPTGISGALTDLRDWLLRQAVYRRRLAVPGFVEAEELDHPLPAPFFAIRRRIRRLLGAVRRPRRSLGEAGSPSSHQQRSPAILSFDGLTAGYGHLEVLFGVDAHVDTNEILALLGTNGAGKTTLLRVLSGLLPARAGKITYDGQDITDLSPLDRVKRGIVAVPGGRSIFGTLSVGENLRMAGWLARREGDKAFLGKQMDWVFELFPVLKERHNQQASLLSGGEQQMLTTAMALLCRPKLLLVDELSLGLAPAVVARLLDVLRLLQERGITLVVVEQSLNVSASAASRALFMERGQIRFDGKVDTLAETDLTRAVFMGSSHKVSAPVPVARGLMTPDEVVLQATHLHKNFGGVVALEDVSLDVRANQIVGIMGSNGAGKTTTLDVLSGFTKPDRGTVVRGGSDLTRASPAKRAAQGLGRTFQDVRLVPSLNVADMLAVSIDSERSVGGSLSVMLNLPVVGQAQDEVGERVDQLLETFNLERYRDLFISELSTGTRRAVELACASARNPTVLLLDEPSSGLAQGECEALAQVLLHLRQATGAALVVVEHDIPLLTSIADEFVCMHLGSVIARGAPAEVLADRMVVASYLGTNPDAINRSGRRTGLVNRPPRRQVGMKRITTTSGRRSE